jgi:hypothetical protein
MMSKRSLRRLKYFSPFLPTVTSFTFTPSFCSSAFLFSACEYQLELRVSTFQMTKSVLLCDGTLHLSVGQQESKLENSKEGNWCPPSL